VIKLCLSSLSLSNFRNYKYSRIEVDSRPVVLIGRNGVGKTNILEAISFLVPGRGLRRSKISEIDNISGNSPWAIAAEICGISGEASIGTGRISEGEGVEKRIVKIDGKIARSQNELAKIFSIIWLTPQMDNLFIEGGTARRKFIDRLVFSFDPEHASRVNAYDNAMRERNRLLAGERLDKIWLNALESKMAEFGVAIAVARQNAVDLLNSASAASQNSFPKSYISLSGEVENLLAAGSALQCEDGFKQLLANNRPQDAAAGRSLVGIHRTSIEVLHVDKNIQVEFCSTGEQKALLVSIILAQSRVGATRHEIIPVLLLDEVTTHLDSVKRSELFKELEDLGTQAWLTGTDREIFDDFDRQIIDVGMLKNS